jgi:hypothetical protein
VYDILVNLRQDLGKEIEAMTGPKANSTARAAGRAYEKARNALSDHLKDETTYGTAAVARRSIDGAYSNFKNWEKEASVYFATNKFDAEAKTNILVPSQGKAASLVKVMTQDPDARPMQSMKGYFKAVDDYAATAHELGLIPTSEKSALVNVVDATRNIPEVVKNLADNIKAINERPTSLFTSLPGFSNTGTGGVRGLVSDAVSLSTFGNTAFQTARKTLAAEKLLVDAERRLNKAAAVAVENVEKFGKDVSKVKALFSAKAANVLLNDAGDFLPLPDDETVGRRTEEAAAQVAQENPGAGAILPLKVQTAVGVLRNKYPVGSASQNSINPLATMRPPSPYEKQVYRKYIDALEHPISTLENLHNNPNPRDTVAALSAVYPAMMNAYRDALIRVASVREKPLPYKQRLLLTHVFGVPLADAERPDLVARLQSIHATNNEQTAQQRVRPVTGIADAARSDVERLTK